MRNLTATGRFLSMTLFLGSVFLPNQAAFATVADGVYAYEKGDYERARQEWLPYAALGNPNALYNLAQLYRMGRGVETDYTKAVEYYLRAAEKGHVAAQRNLGTLYYFGRMGKVDRNKAYEWLSKAAVNGDPRSQLMIGIMFFNGESVTKDKVQAYAWIYLAQQNGLKSADASLEKLDKVLTSDQVTQAKEMAPDLISRQQTPDDIGLMVNQQEAGAEPSGLNSTVPEEAILNKAEEAAAVSDSSQMDDVSDAIADNFRVQIGSYKSEDTAKNSIETLRKKLSDLIGDKKEKIEIADLGEKGIYYRLQLSPFVERETAQRFCDLLKENGQDCYIVKSP